MNSFKTKYLFLLMSVVFFLATSCTSTRKTIKSPLKEEGAAYLLKNMQDNENHFQTFSAKGLATIKSAGKTNDIKINIRIQKDSIIWVSVSVGMGLEAARIMLTSDSVLYINRLEKTFFAGNYKFVNELINAQVDFDIVQALLTGNDFKWYDYQELKATVDHFQYQLESAHRRKLKRYTRHNEQEQVIYQSLWLNSENFKIERLKIKEIGNDNRKIVAEYGNFKSIAEQLIPFQYNIVLSSDNDVVIDATLLKAGINEEITFPFNIPSNFTEIK